MNPCELVAVWMQRCSDGGAKAGFADYAPVAVRLARVMHFGIAAKGTLEKTSITARTGEVACEPRKDSGEVKRSLQTGPHRASLVVASCRRE